MEKVYEQSHLLYASQQNRDLTGWEVVILPYYGGCGPIAHVFCDKCFYKGVSPPKSVIAGSDATPKLGLKKKKDDFILSFSSKGNCFFMLIFKKKIMKSEVGNSTHLFLRHDNSRFKRKK